MQIRHLTVTRFRGIQRLDWDAVGTTVCLIGPGNSTKTTILDAIEYALSSRWNLALTDSDFYQGFTSEPFEIIVTVSQLPKALLTDEKFGLHLRGWNASEGLRDEPQDGDEPALSVRFRADESLEPTWAVVTDRNPDGCAISARDREKLGVVRLTAYLDRQLSWSRGSALSRFTGDIEDIGAILAGASRSARDVIQKADLPKLTEAAGRAQAVAADFGTKPLADYRPALDAAMSSEGVGALSLHEGTVPARQAGLGSRRLLALALQRSAVREGAILLVDEVEQGLEPHRLRHLVRKLRPAGDATLNVGDPTSAPPNGQVFMTTHSSVAVVELAADELHVVRSLDGTTSVNRVPSALQSTIRSAPEALLAESIIVCEGKTEFGLCRALDRVWSAQPHGVAMAYLGVVPTVGESSGSAAPRNAVHLASLGYRTVYFGDSDAPINPNETELRMAGVRVIQWAGNCAIEQRLCLDLPWPALGELVNLACELHGRASVLDAVASRLKVPSSQCGADINRWVGLAGTQAAVRTLVGDTANDKKWFKRIDFGEELGDLVVRHLADMVGTDTTAKINELRQWVHGA